MEHSEIFAINKYIELVGTEKWDETWDTLVTDFATDLEDIGVEVLHLWRKGLVKVLTGNRTPVQFFVLLSEELEESMANKITEVKFSGQHTYIHFKMPFKIKIKKEKVSKAPALKPLAATDSVDDFANAISFEDADQYDMESM